MALKAGVWIDHKQAIVALISDAAPAIKRIAFDVGQPGRPAGKSRPNNKYTPNDFVAEGKLERKLENDLKDYFDDVIACVQGASSLLILGPGEAKGELSKHLKAKKVRGLAVELETADKMTDRQLAAKVKQHFAPSSAKKPVARKKSARTAAKVKAAKPITGKPRKKSGR